MRRPFFLHASILCALFALSCAHGSQSPSSAAEIDLTQPSSERPAPVMGMCTEDEAGCGTSRGKDSNPPASTADQTVWLVPVLATDPVRGPSNALVTLVVFSDFQCPFCKHMAAVLDEVLKNHAKDVRLVWKDFPLPQHEHAQEIASFARAVQAQGGNTAFWAAHDRIFRGQSDIDLRKIAREISGIRWDPIQKALETKQYDRLVIDDFNLGDRLDVRKTPTTFVNGRKAAGVLHAPVLEQLIAEELQKASALVQKGTPPERVYEQIIQGGKQVQPVTDLPAE